RRLQRRQFEWRGNPFPVRRFRQENQRAARLLRRQRRLPRGGVGRDQRAVDQGDVERGVDAAAVQAAPRLVGVLGGRHVVPPTGQRRGDVVAFGRIAVRDERRERAVLPAGARRQQHAERGPLPDPALDGDLAAVIAD